MSLAICSLAPAFNKSEIDVLQMVDIRGHEWPNSAALSPEVSRFWMGPEISPFPELYFCTILCNCTTYIYCRNSPFFESEFRLGRQHTQVYIGLWANVQKSWPAMTRTRLTCSKNFRVSCSTFGWYHNDEYFIREFTLQCDFYAVDR